MDGHTTGFISKPVPVLTELPKQTSHLDQSQCVTQIQTQREPSL